MNSIYLVFCCISLLFGGVVYVALNDIFFTLGIIVISLIYFIFLAAPKIKKSNASTQRFHECYRFINNFIISLNVRGSLIQAFDSVSSLMSKEYLTIINSTKEQSEVDKLHYLERYFPFHIYTIFTTLIEVWLDEGGDILHQTKSLLGEAKNNENILVNSERIFKRKVIEFISLWAFSIAIVIVLRFSLSQFYKQISGQIFFKLSVAAFFLIILVSIEFLIRRGTEVHLKGWNK